ncbi:hypothetical protein TWF694_002651 [Orbilia ellipsospora]|uniref:Uncharacterized protein n=1 Tax=Orbilia ellipsospora TaxID=2528407 RepID=A0AAV9X558_9PEZI
MDCGFPERLTRKRIKPWHLGPNKYSGPEFEAAKEEYRQKYRETGYSEEYVREMYIPDVMAGSKHFHILNEREREKNMAKRKEAEEDWEEIFYKAALREREANPDTKVN